jgi:hypothetical protein
MLAKHVVGAADRSFAFEACAGRHPTTTKNCFKMMVREDTNHGTRHEPENEV